MANREIAKRPQNSVKEIAQYSISFGLFTMVLYVLGFPVFWLVVLATVAVFLWRAFLTEASGNSRPIFEFLLSANSILRDDKRVWYGFEIKETIEKGERITKLFSSPPPLVEFALGALHQRIGDASTAARYLENVVGDGAKSELSIVYPTPELREYVRFLRKIEDSPAEAPITTAAIRSLERMRRLRGGQMLEDCHSKAGLSQEVSENLLTNGEMASDLDDAASVQKANGTGSWRETTETKSNENEIAEPSEFANKRAGVKRKAAVKDSSSRQTISEVLHDIYDTKVN